MSGSGGDGRGRGRARGRGGGGGGLKCFNCNQSGHRKADCPELRRDTPSTSQSPSHTRARDAGAGDTGQMSSAFSGLSLGASAGKCFSCGESGHRKSECPRNRGDSRQERTGSSQPFRETPRQFTPQQQSITRVVKPYKVIDEDIKGCAQPIFVKRPGFGNNGKHIELIANHFRLRITDIDVFQYRIEIKPQSRQPVGAIGGRDTRVAKVRKLNRKEIRDVFNHFVANTGELFGQRSGYPIYDGDFIMITSKKLLHDLFEKNIEIGSERDETFKSKYNINVQFKAKIDLSTIRLFYDGTVRGEKRKGLPREVIQSIQAIELILKQGPSGNRIPIGNSLYPKDSGNPRKDFIDRFNTKFVSYGHYQSLHLSEVGPTVIVDRSCTAFHIGGSLEDYINTLLSAKLKRNIDIHNFDLVRESRWLTNQLKNLRIFTTHLKYNRQYTIKEVHNLPADRIMVPDLRISVTQFFHEKHHKVINGRLPCIKPNGGKDVYLPIEMCYVSYDQPVSRAALTPMDTSSMVRKCGSQKPEDRFNEIYNAVDNIASEGRNYLSEFKLDIDKNPLLISARIIDKPELDPKIEGNNRKLYQTVPLKYWLVVNLNAETSGRYEKFIENIGIKSRSVGFQMSRPFACWDNPLEYRDYDPKLIQQIYKAAIEETRQRGVKVEMIFFILPNIDEVYGDIKLNGDIHNSIVTQCVRSKNVVKPPSDIHYNLLLKINAKLGGINKKLSDLPDKPDILRNRVMIIGADVTHPAPASKLVSSVAACVASYDSEHCYYAASIKIQERSSKVMQGSSSSGQSGNGQETQQKAQEMIKEFDKMIKELLNIYRNENDGHLPDHILYYRDGVSESQFSQVLDFEYKQLLKGCREFNIEPKITIITVQKRHHTRFRPFVRNNDKNGNILPGTTVDRHVTHPSDFDFFLNSHYGIQGTNRPTHYYVLHDDHEFSADELQKLTYYLCYTYARCENPISIPSPVQYAHLAAYRARNHIVACNINAERGSRNDSDAVKRQREIKLAEKLNKEIKVKESLKNRMYYC